jgi:3-dehydroquinate dehydratase/shikimate dehydrogenase
LFLIDGSLEEMMTDLCVSIYGTTVRELQEKAQGLSENLIEIRLDHLKQWSLDELRASLKTINKKIILTWRSVNHGGEFKGAPNELLAIYRKLAEIEPDYLDVEEEILSQVETIGKTVLIGSVHAFHGEIPLKETVDRLREKGAAIAKVAMKVRSSTSAMALLREVREMEGVVFVGLGAEGELTRQLAGVAGMPWTYACIEGEATGPGQLSIETMRHYQIQKQKKGDQIYGLLGDPVSKSIGHIIHNHTLRKMNQHAVYAKFNVALGCVKEFVAELRNWNLGGLCVTMPLKVEVIDALDSIEGRAKLAMAVNTIVIKDGELIGENTDGLGAWDAIEAVSGKARGKNVFVLGAGGASRAIISEGIARGAKIVVFNRTVERAMGMGVPSYSLDELKGWIKKQGYDILINATSVGMAPDFEGTLVDQDWLIPGSIVMEAVSNPKETRLIRDAKACGCITIDGREMFLRQAVKQIVLWTGKKEGVENEIRFAASDSEGSQKSCDDRELAGVVCDAAGEVDRLPHH